MFLSTPAAAAGGDSAQPESNPRFEVASIKEGLRWNRQGPPPIPLISGGPGTGSPERYSIRNYTLGQFIVLAYSIQQWQLAGPAWLEPSGWLDDDRFQLDARVPPGATTEQLRKMLQNLLEERFGVHVHREQRTASVFRLVVEKGQARLKEHVDAPAAENRSSGAGAVGEDGFPVIAPGHTTALPRMTQSKTYVKFVRYSMADLASGLYTTIGRPVVDTTDLPGKYDFYLEWSRDSIGADAAPASDAPDIFRAIRDQLGLKLVSDRASMEFLVVDRANRTPTAN